MNRRLFLVAATAVGLCGSSAAAAPGPKLTVYKTASCGCCRGWVTAMARAGFAPVVVEVEDLSVEWRKRGVPDALSSCHLADIGGYVTVGHVPPADVRRLLKERPKAIGLTVPGMPLGSPGMEQPSGKKEAFETLLLLAGGKTAVFARHA
ncbi:DUF411 domain-containing protein [Phenylobacterium sp.]|jgi:hypothetical protein|uniref:DUF411 domain-containing protein n=1 Tax=Phenylobacterium sp. TaxID=1871053 RepID=UPI002E32935E|nr:DUF411 domain-containing protein [Phenylobacterium sp.]HEX2560036.1 DUF411 domain-containing protein [Phenylobacterium sp.]